ncbi:ABC transporter substrate-binding protein [Polymorphospora rubra]|uniref:ABC transporter substrate-binding protein n=1 Tax=Polymorphospora rubra TaxID=338584 RepID=UPI0033C2A674
MRRIRSVSITALTAAVLASSLAGCQFTQEERDTREIVVGADLELSGSAAAYGEAYRRALELKAEQLNESGVLGDRRIRVDIKDNRSDANESLRNVSDFAKNNSVSAVIMGGCSECAIGALPTITDNKLPTVALAPANDVASPAAERRYMFKLGLNAADSAAALVGELRRKEVTRAALLHTDDSYGQEGQAALAAEFQKANIRLTRTQAVKADATNIDSAVRSATSGNTDALVVWTGPEQALMAASAARQANFDGELYFDAAAASGLFFGGNASESTNGATMVFTQTMVIDDVIATTPAKAARKQWFRDYTARYGGYDGISSFAADALQLVADSVLGGDGSSGSPNRDGIRDVLETSQFDGLSGPIRITPDNHSGLMPQALTMLVARSGRWRLAG